jgi:hypothetical protein
MDRYAFGDTTEDTSNFNGADFGRYQHIVVVFNAPFNSQSGTVIVGADHGCLRDQQAVPR